MFRNTRLLSFGKLAQALLIVALMTHCGRKAATNAPVDDSTVDVDSTIGDVTDATNTLKNKLPSLGKKSGMTSSDILALGNLLSVLPSVEPEAWKNPFEAEIKRLIKEIEAEEAAGKDATAKRIALSGTIINSCTEAALKYMPKPGEALHGTWKATGCGKTYNPTVGYNPAVNELEHPSTYNMTDGDTSFGAIVHASKDAGLGNGFGKLLHPNTTAERRNGVLLDHEPVWGKQFTPGYRKGYYNFDGCRYEMVMVQSANPIPGHAEQAMKIFGKCFGNALLLIDPLVQKLFKKMDPELSKMLQGQIFGM